MTARRKIRLATVLAAAGAALTAMPAILPAFTGTFSYTGSFQLAQGSYFFDQTTRGFYFFNGFSFTSEAFTLTANIPLIYQSTPYVSYSGVGVLPSGGSKSSLIASQAGRGRGRSPVITLPEPETFEYKQFGVGDPLIRLGIRLWKEGRYFPSVDLAAQAKVPLASVDSGFGTGKWDYGAGLSLAKKLGRVFLFADVNYWTLGDLPDLEIKDPWSYALSVGLPFSKGKAALLVSYFGLTEIIAGVEPPSSIGLGLSFKVGPKSSLMLNGSLGLSESSPDFTASLGWSLGF